MKLPCPHCSLVFGHPERRNRHVDRVHGPQLGAIFYPKGNRQYAVPLTEETKPSDARILVGNFDSGALLDRLLEGAL